MSQALFLYPPKAAFGRAVPKSKVYEHSRPSAAVRQAFVTQVERIVWQAKLAPETINLPPRAGVEEIQAFALAVKQPALSPEVLRSIDKTTPHPIFFELAFEGRLKVVAAYKRRSEADSAKWVLDGYFETDWQAADAPREPLPVALDLAGLYEQMLRRLLPLQARTGETLKAQVERIIEARALEVECRKLETRLAREKQFNRKVELNAQLREVREALSRKKDEL